MTHRTLRFLFTIIVVVSLFSACSKKENETTETNPTELKQIRYLGSYTRDFNDLNELHLRSAESIGIKPLSNREEANKLKGKLVKIQSGKYCDIDELTHSIPYLIPEAAFLLYTIGKNFADSLATHNAPRYKPIVTSITRTEDDIKKLGRHNVNASQNSAHRYGTTFDISWRRFNKADNSSVTLTEEQLKMLLANVLRDLQKQNRCYIKHEKKQACFHITAR